MILKRMLTSFLIMAIIVLPASLAAQTTEEWEADLEAYTNAMTEPKDYLKALDLSKKWIDYSEADAVKAHQITGLNDPAENLTIARNNVYREVAANYVEVFNQQFAENPVEAAKLGIGLQTFLDDNPEMLDEFAAANNMSNQQMTTGIDEAIKQSFIKTYTEMAKVYSKLMKDGEKDQALKLATKWKTVVDDLAAAGNPLPQQFQDFTNIDLSETLEQAGDLTHDAFKFTELVKNGNFDEAFALIDKWEKIAATDPTQLTAVNYLLNENEALKITTAEEWADAFENIRAATYETMFNQDLQKYKNEIASGNIDGALALVNKWQEIINSVDPALADKIAQKFNITKEEFSDNLDAQADVISNIETEFQNANVEEFKKDLDEYNQCVEIFTSNPTGSDEWYSSAARAMELAGKWSRISEQNPSLATEITEATGIVLPRDSDEVVKVGLDAAMQDSAKKFNEAMGNGDFNQARDYVNAWLDYLENHPRVNELAGEKWGDEFIANLENYKKGLTIMLGEDPEEEVASQTYDPQPTEGDDGTEEDVNSQVDTSGSNIGFGASE
ncbi:MAG: hypothetical protein ACQETH_06275 [Candidatus Rifleibacteriota bacterium]